MKRSNEEKVLNDIQLYLQAIYKKELGNAIRKGKLEAKRRRYEATN
jgi:hypothetical protein